MATSTLGSGTLVLAGTTSGTTTVTATAVAGTTTLTLPAATDTLVGKATTDTLTNKTLTGAVMNGTLGATTPSTVAATTLTTSSTVTHNGGTANGVGYLDGSKVLTTGSALVFDGTNLGIKFTPSAWQANNRAIQVADGYASLSGNSSQGTCDVAYNCYNSTSQAVLGWKYTNSSAAATLYQQLNGAHAWHIAPSGTADAAVSFTQAMTIDSSGNLLVGTTSASGRLTVQGAVATSASYAAWVTNSASTILFAIRNDGYINIGLAAASPYNNTTGAAANLHVDSNGSLLRSTSSLKYKNNVQDATHGLADLLQLRSVTYEGKAETDAGKTFGGFIAEEVHEAGLTEFVQYAEDGSPDALAYGNMVSLCVKAIQEQQAFITTLTARITALESA